MRISISGTPGTGKTEVSKALAEMLGYNLVSVNDFAVKEKLITEEDNERRSFIIDEKKLNKASKKIPDNTIIEGHLAQYCISDITIILRTDPDELSKRLKKRHWSEKKIKENVEAEILDIILAESAELNMYTYELDTTSITPQEAAEKIKEIIEDEKAKDLHRPGTISWHTHMDKLSG